MLSQTWQCENWKFSQLDPSRAEQSQICFKFSKRLKQKLDICIYLHKLTPRTHPSSNNTKKVKKKSIPCQYIRLALPFTNIKISVRQSGRIWQKITCSTACYVPEENMKTYFWTQIWTAKCESLPKCHISFESCFYEFYHSFIKICIRWTLFEIVFKKCEN